jgi:putative glycosyltransferase (TIGR04372 family)
MYYSYNTIFMIIKKLLLLKPFIPLFIKKKIKEMIFSNFFINFYFKYFSKYLFYNISNSNNKIESLIFIKKIEFIIKNFLKYYIYEKNDLKYLVSILKNAYLLKDEISILKFLLIKLFKKYPHTTILIYKCYFNKITIKDVDFFEHFEKTTIDRFLSAYIFVFFITEAYTNINYENNKLKKIINNLLRYFNDFYFLEQIEYLSETSLCCYDFYKKINKQKNKFYNDKTNTTIGLSTYAFGHLCSIIDYKFRNKSKSKIFLHEKYIGNKILGKYLNLKYNKKIKFDNLSFIKQIKSGKLLPMELYHSFLDKSLTVFNVTYNDYQKNKNLKPSINFALIKKIINKEKDLKILLKEKYICYYSRYKEFKNENYNHDLLNKDRFSDINLAGDALKFFMDNGYKVVVMGGPKQKKLNLKNNQLIDYAHSKYKNDTNDILLPMNCEFMLHNGDSGTSMLNTLFGKYSLNIEYPFNRKPIFDPRSYYLLRPIYKNKIKLNINSFFNQHLFTCYDYGKIKNLGYCYKNNNKKTILNSAILFLNIFKKKFDEKKLLKLQHKKLNFFYNILRV